MRARNRSGRYKLKASRKYINLVIRKSLIRKIFNSDHQNFLPIPIPQGLAQLELAVALLRPKLARQPLVDWAALAE